MDSIGLDLHERESRLWTITEDGELVEQRFVTSRDRFTADPGFAAMYATRSKRVKTDQRDARTLCAALQLGAYRAVHRASDAQRHLRAHLAVRDALVRTRTRYIALIKATVRREGWRLPSGEAEPAVARLAALPSPPTCARSSPHWSRSEHPCRRNSPRPMHPSV